jgi:hypothetical protein
MDVPLQGGAQVVVVVVGHRVHLLDRDKSKKKKSKKLAFFFLFLYQV